MTDRARGGVVEHGVPVRPGIVVLVSVGLLLPAIFALDAATPDEVTLAALYLVPVGLATWFGGPVPGGLAVVLATASGFVANQVLQDAMYTHPVVGFWNPASRFATYAALWGVISTLRRYIADRMALAAIVDAASDAIVAVDEDGRIARWNPAAARLVGYPPAEALRRPLRELLLEADADACERALEAARRGEPVPPLDSHWVCRNGEVVEISASLAHVEGADVVIVARNVGPLNDARRRLEQANAALARSNHELEAFAHVLSHDLKEPLRSVTSYLQLVARRAPLDETARQWVEAAVAAAARMDAMVRDLLDWSRVDADRQPFAPVPLDAVLDEALGNLGEALHETGATVHREPLPIASGDRGLLLRLLQNLLSNALKYHADRPVEITVSGEETPEGCHLVVRDNGVGIAPADQERIFAMFQRGSSKVAGSGVGLAVVKRIAEAHGGRVWVESTPGEGSAFHVSLGRGVHAPSSSALTIG